MNLVNKIVAYIDVANLQTTKFIPSNKYLILGLSSNKIIHFLYYYFSIFIIFLFIL